MLRCRLLYCSVSSAREVDEGVEVTSVNSAAVRFLENELDGGFELLSGNEKVSVRSEEPEEIGDIMWTGEEVVRIDPLEAIEVGMA